VDEQHTVNKEETERPMATLEAVIRFPLTSAGIKGAREELDRVEHTVDPGQRRARTRAAAPAATERSRGSVLFEHLASSSRGRDLIRVLPEGKKNGLTPEQLASVMKPGPNGKPLEKSSVRAVIRNAWRGAEELKKRGQLDSRVIQRHFEQYGSDGAGRYYLEPGDGKGVPGR